MLDLFMIRFFDNKLIVVSILIILNSLFNPTIVEALGPPAIKTPAMNLELMISEVLIILVKITFLVILGLTSQIFLKKRDRTAKSALYVKIKKSFIFLATSIILYILVKIFFYIDIFRLLFV